MPTKMSKLDNLQHHVGNLVKLLNDRQLGLAVWWMMLRDEMQAVSEIYEEYMDDGNEDN